MADEKKKTRKLTREESKELQETVNQWLRDKQIVDPLDKANKVRASRIKELMMISGMKEVPDGDFVAKLSFKHTETMNEDALLNWIMTDLWAGKGSMTCPYIKRVPVIDWEALEKDIYNEKIPKEKIAEMDKFKESVDTPVLKYSKKKKEEE